MASSRLASNGRSNGRPTVAATNGHLSRKASGTARRAKPRVRLLPSVHSEKGREALLQTGVSAQSDRLVVDYSDGKVQLRLSGQGVPFLEGAWETTISLDGRKVDCHGAWESVCWNADEDADYLELKLETRSGLRIERQLLLPRKGHLAFLADSIIAPVSAPLTYQSCLSLADGLQCTDDTATNSATIRGKAGSARIYPLALASERSGPASGQLTSGSGTLELMQQQTGKALYAPLVIDWAPERRRAVPLWRRLTVSEVRRPVAADVAVAFRLQVGSDQWLVYHSLQNTREPRTALGHHTWYETVIGTFGRDGVVDPLIQIE